MKVKSRIRYILFNEISVFVSLWIIYLLLPVLLDLEREEFGFNTSELVFTGYYFCLAAFNNFYLIPRFLSVGKYVRYLGAIIFLLLALSLVEETLIEWMLGMSRGIFHFGWRGFWYSFLRMGTIIIIFGSFKLIWDHQERLRKISDLEKERVESELKFLKSQINPHVMFNNLNSIYYYALEKSDKAPQMILKLSEVMRYMIYEANEKFVPLEKELEYINNFIELERIRLEDRGEVQFVVDGDPNNLHIAPLLLISFIENSFKHSMETRNDDIWVLIRIKIKNDRLIFSAENNWSESAEEDRPNSEGIGLQNVKKRLSLLYPNRHELQISQTEELFKVFLTIDLSHEKYTVPDT